MFTLTLLKLAGVQHYTTEVRCPESRLFVGRFDVPRTIGMKDISFLKGRSVSPTYGKNNPGIFYVIERY